MTIIQGYALKEIPKLEDGSIDLVLTDPPFFTPATHYQSRVNKGKKWADMSILSDWWGFVCDALLPKLKATAHMVTFCNSDSYPVFYPVMYDRWDKLKALVWDKQRVGLGRIYRNQTEFLIWARNQAHYLPTDSKLRADILRYKATPPKDRYHPVQKPIDLLGGIIEALCPEGGLVVDPFMGSGTTGEAAIELGREFIGIEADKNYYNRANQAVYGLQGETDATP